MEDSDLQEQLKTPQTPCFIPPLKPLLGFMWLPWRCQPQQMTLKPKSDMTVLTCVWNPNCSRAS